MGISDKISSKFKYTISLLTSAAVVGGVLSSYIMVQGSKDIELLRIEAERQQIISERRHEYLLEIFSLYEELRKDVAVLALDNSYPLEQEIVNSILRNLGNQDQRLLEIQSTGGIPEVNLLEGYRQNLLSIRSTLLKSDDPGDLVELWPLVVKMVNDLNDISNILNATSVVAKM